MKIDKRKKKTNEVTQRRHRRHCISERGRYWTRHFYFRHLTAFFGPLEAKRMGMLETVEIW